MNDPITIEQLEELIEMLRPRKTFVMCNPANEEQLEDIVKDHPSYELKPTSYIEKDTCVLVSEKDLLFPIRYSRPMKMSELFKEGK